MDSGRANAAQVKLLVDQEVAQPARRALAFRGVALTSNYGVRAGSSPISSPASATRRSLRHCLTGTILSFFHSQAYTRKLWSGQLAR